MTSSAHIAAYKAVVTGSESEAWEGLLRMGRPLWKSYATERAADAELGPPTRAEIVDLAARKLLRGQPVDTASSYNEHTLFGVAAMLCRLGLRPRASSPLARRLVEDFMAVLAHVTHESGHYIASYPSDPMLALGATKVWYGVENALSTFILPQLKRLLLNEALAIGEGGSKGVDKIVACIVLLLAMDKCVMRDTKVTENQFESFGQFVPVHEFLRVLGVGEMPVKGDDMSEAKKATGEAFERWLQRWDGWQMSFTHFNQLQLEPNEDTLWYLLGRRAAGVLPHGQHGADLLIPMFRKASMVGAETEISLMLVRVADEYPRDAGLSEMASTMVSPSYVFGQQSDESEEDSSVEHEGNPLSKIAAYDMIRIFMKIQAEGNDMHYRFIYCKEVEAIADENDVESSELGFTLCFRSLHREAFAFLDAEVARKLARLVESEWDPMALVDGDLEERSDVESTDAAKKIVMSAEKLRKSARRALLDIPGNRG